MRPTQTASQQANQWAQKKKEQMEKAAQLKAERKQQLASTGEMALGPKNNYDYNKPSNIVQPKQQTFQSDYGNSNYRQQFNPQFEMSEDVLYQMNRQSSLGKQQQQQQQQQQQKIGYGNYNKPPSQEQPRIQQSNIKQQQNQSQQSQVQSVQKQPQYGYNQYSQQNRPLSGKQEQLDFALRQNNTIQRKYEQQQEKAPIPPRQQIGRQQQQQIQKPQQQQQIYYNPNEDLPIKKESTQMLMNAKPEPLYECSKGCGRSFAKQALEKHEKICVKVFQKQRKQFDSQKHRIVNKDQVGYLKNLDAIDQKYEKALARKPDWKQQSEAFRAGIKAAKGGKLTAAQQNALNKAATSHLIPCQYCGRKFNEQAAQKHIPFCAQKQKIPPPQPKRQQKR